MFYGAEAEDKDNHKDNPDPFLFSDTKVMTGQGRAIVCSVGDNTLLAKIRNPSSLELTEEHTQLEEKLQVAANQIGKYAIAGCGVFVAVSLLFLVGLNLLSNTAEFFSNDTLLKLSQIGIQTMVLLIVCLPEGLPLAVSLAMAISTSRMKDDKILIKNLESIQTCAMLHELCVSKTGTLTKGDLNVAKF